MGRMALGDESNGDGGEHLSMTTIVVVKKNGFAAIAADTLTTFGSTKESAEYVVNNEKIIRYRENYLALTGWGSSQHALEDLLSRTKKKISFETVADIFRAGLLIHQELKDNYFLLPEDSDSDSFETSRSDILIANSDGIFALTEYRYVQEFSRFYAYGSGNEFALGAMFAVYGDEDKTAEEVALVGINAGAEFDDGTSLPANCYTVKLNKK